MDTTTFWHTTPRPIIALAPMDGVTDQPFRHIQKRYGNPALMYTEFTNVEGLCYGATRLLRDFLFDETQRPIIAQIYGATPEAYRQVAVILCELGFDGIDINMGCPAKNIASSGCGAALIRTPKLAQEIVRATQLGVQQWQNGMTSRGCPDIKPRISNEVERRHALLPAQYRQRRAVPVSVKTRIGYDIPVVEEWVATLLETEPVAIGLHGRTLEQGYSGLADWEEIARAAEIIHETPTLALGNGDVKSLADAYERVEQYGVDGVLIGRAAFGNPYIFQGCEPSQALAQTANGKAGGILPHPLSIALEHAHLFEQTYGHEKKYRFHPMRKHLGWYVKGIPGAAKVRGSLVRTHSPEDVAALIEEFCGPLPERVREEEPSCPAS